MHYLHHLIIMSVLWGKQYVTNKSPFVLITSLQGAWTFLLLGSAIIFGKMRIHSRPTPDPSCPGMWQWLVGRLQSHVSASLGLHSQQQFCSVLSQHCSAVLCFLQPAQACTGLNADLCSPQGGCVEYAASQNLSLSPVALLVSPRDDKWGDSNVYHGVGLGSPS